MTYTSNVVQPDGPGGNQFGLPLLIDTGAIALGDYVVLDCHYKVVRAFDTLEEAIAFIATANGCDVETVQRDSVKRAQMLHEYRRNLKRRPLP